MLDIGGGSMQLVHVQRRLARELVVAARRCGMTERFLADDKPAKPKQLRELRAFVAGALVRRAVGEAVRLADRRDRGTMRPRRRRPARGRHRRVRRQGFVLTRDALDALVEELAELPPSERGRVPGIKPGRADIILGGALVVQAVMDEGGFEAIDVTEAGLREGSLRALPRRSNGGEALFDDVRRASVVNLAAQ